MMSMPPTASMDTHNNNNNNSNVEEEKEHRNDEQLEDGEARLVGNKASGDDGGGKEKEGGDNNTVAVQAADDTSSRANVAATDIINGVPPVLRCWQCGGRGHLARFCKGDKELNRRAFGPQGESGDDEDDGAGGKFDRREQNFVHNGEKYCFCDICEEHFTEAKWERHLVTQQHRFGLIKKKLIENPYSPATHTPANMRHVVPPWCVWCGVCEMRVRLDKNLKQWHQHLENDFHQERSHWNRKHKGYGEFNFDF